MNESATPASTIIPLVSTAQLHEIERRMVEVYGIALLQTMEYAGLNLAQLVKLLLDDDIMDRPIVILAGQGNQGGSALVAARHLLNWGAWVQIVLTHPVVAYQGAPAHQLITLQAMGAPLAWAEEGWELPPTDLIVDAIAGDDSSIAPHGKARDLIHLANSSRAPILSLNAPSGLDLTTGQRFTPHIQATATMILALPPQGLATAGEICGDLYLADMGVPLQLYADLGLDVPPIFAQATILSIVITTESATIVYE